MSATYRTVGNVSSSAVTMNLAADTPAGVVDGDVEILIVVYNDNTATLTAPAGWTLVPGTPINASTTLGIAMYYHVVAADGPTITATSNNNQAYLGFIVAFKSDAATTPVEFIASLNQALAVTAITCPAVTCAFINEPVLLLAASLVTGTFTGPTGFTERIDATANSVSASLYTSTAFKKGAQAPQVVTASTVMAAMGVQLCIAPSRVITEQSLPLTVLDIQSLQLAVTG